MAFMNKMRDSMPVVFAGLAGIFLLMIVFEWGGQGMLFKSSGPDGETAGMVNGVKITIKELDQETQNLEESQKQQQKKTDLSEAEISQAQDQAWDDLVSRALVKQSIEKLGLSVTDQEIRDEIYDNPPEFARRQFTDSLGQFHQQEYFAAIRNPKNDTIVRKALIDPAREQLLFRKWSAIMTSSIRITDADLYDRFRKTTAKATIQFVKIAPKANPRDFMSAVTDAEIKTYYDEHQWMFKRDETRKIKFVPFQQLPTPKDSILTVEKLTSIKERLAAADPSAADSVARDLSTDYSDEPYAPAKIMTPTEWGAAPNAAQLESAQPGETFTTFSGQKAAVSRVIAVIDTGDTYFRSRHILIGFGQGTPNKDSAKALADKIYAQLKGGADFGELARQYSTDPGSAKHGGELGWIGPKKFVKEYEAVAMSAPINQVQAPVASQFGYHIIEVEGRTNRKLKVVSVQLSVKPSSQTLKMISQQAQIFHDQASKTGFDQAAKAAGYRVIADAPPIQKKGQAMFGSKDFNDWVFDAKKDDISAPMQIPAARITIVAQVTDIQPDGIKPVDEVKDEIRSAIARKKLVESVATEAKQLRSQIGADGDLTKLTASGDSSLKPTTVTLGPAESVQGLSLEYAVNNAAFAMKPGEISQPIKGQSAYYIVKLISRTDVTKEEFEAQKQTLLQSALREAQQAFITQWIDKQKEDAKIVDYRNKTR